MQIVDNKTPVSAETFNHLQDLIKKDIATQIADLKAEAEKQIANAKLEALQETFPIGSTYVTQEETSNPNTILGFGT